MSISNRTSDLVIEYDKYGERATKYFPPNEATKAKRFFAMKDKEGKNPRVIKPKKTKEQYTAIYVRVSTNKQSLRSQLPDLETYSQTIEGEVRWYKEKHTGTTMDRPVWKQLEDDIHMGRCKAVCVWKLCRLGRTAAGLTNLFEMLQQKSVNLVSIKDHLDFSTASGRLFANMLASISAFEVEQRRERILAGQAKARAEGKRWGGNKHRKSKVTPEMRKTICTLHKDGVSKSKIAQTVSVTRSTVYSVLRDEGLMVCVNKNQKTS